MQYTFVGAPMIYYGTEAGMWSPDDPSNRQPMVWRDLLPYEDPQVEFKADLFAHYQRLAAVREKLDALREGFYVPLIADDGNNVLAYQRSAGDQHVYVVINRSNREQKVAVPVAEADRGKPLVNWMDEQQATLVAPDIKANATARPALKLTGMGGVESDTGKVRVALPAYGVAVLSQVK
jgi:maltooligosyltrehalose synthase